MLFIPGSASQGLAKVMGYPKRIAGLLLMALAVTISGAKPASAQGAWESEYQSLIKAAQEEGELVIDGGTGSPSVSYPPVARIFGEKYGIDVTFFRPSGAHAEFVLAAQNAGKFEIDVLFLGPTTLGRLIAGGGLVPVEPFFLRPDVKDPSNWFKGRHWWVDDQQKYAYNFAGEPSNFNLGARHNTNVVPPAEVKKMDSIWDYLDPKFKGKFVALPPTIDGGTGLYHGAYSHPMVGKEFVRRFIAEHGVTFTQNEQLIKNGMLKGKFGFSVGIAGTGRALDRLARKGAPIARVDQEFKEGFQIRSGTSQNHLSVAKNPPHPNAAKLFVNWWLSPEGQTTRHKHAKLTPDPTFRTDLDLPPRGGVPELDPTLDYFFPGADPEVIAQRKEAMEFARKIYLETR